MPLEVLLEISLSHYTTLRTEITNVEALVAALADVGYRDVEVHEHAQPLRGWLGDERTQRAHVVIRRQQISRLSNDIGFERQPDGRFLAVISDYDRPQHDEKWLGQVSARHAYHATAKTLAAQGFDLVSEDQDRDGTVRMVLRRVTV